MRNDWKTTVAFPALVVAALALGTSAVWAADAATPNGIPTMSGGVGADEMNYIQSVQDQYNLKLLFTEANGEYLSSLPVHIEDMHGQTVLDTVTDGPALLVTLPPGKYKVSASVGAEHREQKVSVSTGKALHEYQMRFNAGDDTQTSGL